MLYRFLLFLLLVYLTCASGEAKGTRSRSSKRLGSLLKPSHTTHRIQSWERTHPTTRSHTSWNPTPLTSVDNGYHHPRTTHRNTFEITPAPNIMKSHPTNPPWSNPYFPPTQRPRNPNGSFGNPSAPVNTHGMSVSSTTKSPSITRVPSSSTYNNNKRNVTSTFARPSNSSPSIGNSTFTRNSNVDKGDLSNIEFTHIQNTQRVPSAPYPNPSVPYPPFNHPNPNQWPPIRNAPPYPVQPPVGTFPQHVLMSPQHVSTFPQHPPMPPQHPPMSPQHVPTSSQRIPTFPQHPPMSPQHPPMSPQHPPMSPQHVPTFPQSVSTFPQHGATFPQHVPTFPATPSQTIIMMPNQQESGRGTGQIFKEALIFSGVNAAVNRIINPSHHHHHFADYGRPIGSTPNVETSNTHSTTHTEITYNNNYINSVPANAGIASVQHDVDQSGLAACSGTLAGQPCQPGTMIPNQTVTPGVVGQPMVPGTATVGQPVVPNSTNAQPDVLGTSSVGQPAVPGTSSTVQRDVLVTPSTGQPIVPVSANSEQPGQTTAAGSSTIPVNKPTVPKATASNSAASATGTGTDSAPITNAPETAVNTVRYRITDQELQLLSEDLYNKDEFNAYKYITLNMQSLSTGPNATDQAAEPLFQVMPIAYTIPTVQALRSLYEEYVLDSQVKEIITMERRKKENILLDVFLNTNVMSIAMNWLYKQGFVKDDDYDKKDMLNRIWFTPFDGTSSGFERVFAAELFEGTDILGVQNWAYFDYQESKNRINYLGYVDKLQLGDKASLLKVDFRLDGVLRQNSTLFIGTSPELEMALYTICYYARPGDVCPIFLGGTKLNLYTHPYRYLGNDMIDLALTIF